MSNKDIDLEKVRNRFSELFSKQNLEALREAEEKAACQACGRVILCGKIHCEFNSCELKERQRD